MGLQLLVIKEVLALSLSRFLTLKQQHSLAA
jgi:hypothetical protein